VSKGKKIVCVAVNPEVLKNLVKMVATVKSMVKMHNGKFPMKKQSKEYKACTRLRSVKSKSGSDFAVKCTMNVPPLDSTGKVDPMAAATGEVAREHGITASTGKKCHNDYITLYDVSDVVIKLYLCLDYITLYDVSHVVIKLHLCPVVMCKNKVYPYYIHKCLPSPILLVLTYICCLSVMCTTIDCIIYVEYKIYVEYNSTPYIIYVTRTSIYRGGSPYNSIDKLTSGNKRSNWRDKYRE
jgi:hypothetical protein